MRSPTMAGLSTRVYKTARDVGPRAALAVQHGASDEPDEDVRPVVGPGGHVMAPLDFPLPAGARMLPTPIPAGLGVAVWRHDMPDGAAAADYGGWCETLSWLRLGLCDRLLDTVLVHLSGRTSGGEPLLRRQLLKGALADVEIERHELRAMLAELDTADGTYFPALADLHERITDSERALLRLSGAHGFTAHGPGALAHTSELLGDVYVGGGADVAA
ncbi:acyl-CoA dehydrogenase family protein [Streptomyces prasinopilosus]|uniref:Acyl-CoA dehydrogenase, C-terminal domain n=1 Tax=Streptomyces prasinopilosus TaxID=67344 RepID=A0A1G6M559_9ACTN|nr:acyl-CoA dehydrogenase family protein [Streptomyces prasinopilosus]SDC50096.1 Acyl-CoA dehydrogenase, C-terminal domain [Streptomyces prasinopilosus]